MRLTIAEIATHLGLLPPAGAEGVVASGVAIDSRLCRPGDIFICIRGEHTDGHDHAATAVRNGACAVLASRELPGISAPVLRVGDTVQALGRIASLWRSMTRATVICVTGTAGKTTLKDLLADILASDGKTGRSDKNHNNQIGLPCSILAMDGTEKFWVLEAGISHVGDMEELGAIARPDMAIILNIGAGHTAGLANRGVAWHKTRLLNYLSQGGSALVSADYPELANETALLGTDVRFFSTGQVSKADFTLANASSGTQTAAIWPGGGECHFAIPDFLHPETALAAAAAAHILGVSCEGIRHGIENMKMPEHRYNMKHFDSWRAIDDCYNANPLSMARMLENARKQADGLGLPLIAVLGEMGELGEMAELHHRKLGRVLAQILPDRIFWKGGFGDIVRDGLETGGQDASSFEYTGNVPDFGKKIDTMLDDPKFASGGIAIFKGSRFNHMEDYWAEFVRIMQNRTRGADVL